ncbi:hypothetical protein Poli38472_007765 [Pythium oligandrum]|uniref:Calmodulin n=1 Tax=Pythium oligandrum TaxID=41045 RepID=A0A8K1CTN9_PYTOL|nr:hypothetical protein Poli38472_007765 [Pythium oligandrum]|eukprot:TMW68093.1 hypothetical protein Poli38472_007765 [Pythium oligandrum]
MATFDEEAYAAEYWALDAEAYGVCAELAPEYAGDSVALGDLDELCRRMRRPLRDDRERLQLMTDLDPQNDMRISRAAFTAWLVQDLYQERQLALAREYHKTAQTVPVATPTWEEVHDDPETTYYHNVFTGETSWDRPVFIQSVWKHLHRVEEVRLLKAGDSVVFSDVATIEMLADLRDLFVQYDEDRSETLDTSEFQDLCVAMGVSLGGGDGQHDLFALIQEIDPFSASGVVSWEAMMHYWISNAPFQRRSKINAPFELWERVESLHLRNTPVMFRHTVTQAERWNHPEMEQRIVNLLTKLFPSSKLEWKQRIQQLYEIQAQLTTKVGDAKQLESKGEDVPQVWSIQHCRSVLGQLGHECTRKSHLEAAIAAINSRYGDPADPTARESLTETTVERWMLQAIERVEMNGWEEAIDPSTGQVYYYHEVNGVTQWDPPHLEAQMNKMMTRFASSGDDNGSLSIDDRIQRIFRHYDIDESGTIGFDEFQRMYVAMLGRKEALDEKNEAARQQIRQVFAVLDTSGDGDVSLDEFTTWWKTKMQIEATETDEAKRLRVAQDRWRVAVEFLRNQDVLIAKDAVEESEPVDEEGKVYWFESNILPRLVGLLGKYPLKGLAYRQALKELVHTIDQEVRLQEFLTWYLTFEAREREKEEMEILKARALAQLKAQEAEAKEKARKLKMLRKGQLITKVIAEDKDKPPEPAELVWKRHIETLFRKFDRDSSGYLDVSELQQLTHALGQALNHEQVQQMMAVMDTSSDEQVSFDEFFTFWSAFQRRKAQDGSPAGKKKKATAATTESKEGDGDPKRREAISMIDASARWAVRMDLAKDKALNLSIQDVRGALSDWKDALLDRPRKKKESEEKARQDQLYIEELKQRRVFIPTKRRRYAHLDVTWIEPEVVRCVVDIIRTITLSAHPPPRQDAAQRIQRIMRGVLTRKHMLEEIKRRFQTHIDVNTSFYYYVDTDQNGRVWLNRPVYPTITSSAFPWDSADCRTKVERYQFDKRKGEMRRKRQFYEAHVLSTTTKWSRETWESERRLFVPSSFVLYDILESVRHRMLGSIWTAIRDRDLVLVELMAHRHLRQLYQRSGSDAASPLPLHHVVQHHQDFSLSVIRAVFEGYPEAVRCQDAYGRTPLHHAFRARASFTVIQLLLSRAIMYRDRVTREKRTVWEIQSTTGDTPLHTALRYGISLEVLRWVLKHIAHKEKDAPCLLDTLMKLRNKHDQALFHLTVDQFDASSTVRAMYWKSVVLILLRTWQPSELCAYPNKTGDLPLHLAIEGYNRVLQPHSQSECTSSETETCQWLIGQLITALPVTLLTRRWRDDTLAIHLLIRFKPIPDTFVCELLQSTMSVISDASTASTLLQLPVTKTTLLHYALLHRPHAESLLLELLRIMPTACQAKMQPNDDFPLHLAALHGASSTILTRMIEICPPACQERNKKREYPLHMAIQSDANESVANVRLLLQTCPFILSDQEERRGLRALVLAANQKRPNAQVLLELLEQTPAQPLGTTDRKQRQSVTPLYALSMRKCDADITQSRIVRQLENNFEGVDDEDAYFLALAKAKHRKQHHCPNPQWTFPKILELVEHNPIDEAVIQRALLAINQKLECLHRDNQSTAQEVMANGEDPSYQVILESVTLNADWMLVRRVHQIMYEMPWNARIQLLGQAILKKLLPNAYAKATYKARIDPYFNL